MYEKEAIEQIERIRKILGTIGEIEDYTEIAIKALEEIQKYRAIGTVEECRAAVEKEKIRKPIGIDMCTCPMCYTQNKVFKNRRNTVAHDVVYCWHCGQAIEINRSDE